MTLSLFTSEQIEACKAQPRVKPGELWAVDDHRVWCGDATEPESYRVALAGERAQVADVDGPYGMSKAEWDRLSCRDYRAFYVKLYTAARPSLLDNASVYQWGNAPQLWRWWEAAEEGTSKDRDGWTLTRRCEDLPLWGVPVSLRSCIVWDKGGSPTGERDANGDPLVRCYPPATERALFWMLGSEASDNNADRYFEGFEPIRAYLYEQRKIMGWNGRDIKEAAGHNPTGHGDHWTGRSQWAMPTEQVYSAWQVAANGAAFTREYQEIHREYLAARAPCDVTPGVTDVWTEPRVSGAARWGHPTPKPVKFARRICKTSTRRGDICLVPFAGSSPWSEAAPALGRVLVTMDTDPHWCDVALTRLERVTGKTARRV